MNYSYSFFNKSFSKSFMNSKKCFGMFNSKINTNKFLTNFSNKHYHSHIIFLTNNNMITFNGLAGAMKTLQSSASQQETSSFDDLTTQIVGQGKDKFVNLRDELIQLD